MSDPAGTGIPTLDIPFPQLSHRLLAWFFRNKRDLPWREEHDPYRIWISEVMLQQTRSDTAARYYLRWLERFPTLESLARAEQEEVLKAWEGLGYYGRARNLHRSARIIFHGWRGGFPDTQEKIRELPGVGEYTAAAVLSIAFAKPLGVVDGNVLRVVSRLLADDGAGGTEGKGSPGADRGRLKKRARAFVEASFLAYHPGWINQAWMELGALICLPAPRCCRCPLADACRAYRQGRTGEFPPRVPSRPLPLRSESLLLLLPSSLPEGLRRSLEGTGEQAELPGQLLRSYRLPLLLVRRAGSGLLGGLWELPNFPGRGDRLSGTLAALSIEVLLDTGREVSHRYSHFEVRFRLLVASLQRERRLEPWQEQRWVLPAELESYPRPKVHIRAMRELGLI